jgi:proteic killer suppression protein
MIKSFRHAGLEKFYKTGSRAGIQPHHANKLRVQLTALNEAKQPSDLATPLSWGLHRLAGGLGLTTPK